MHIDPKFKTWNLNTLLNVVTIVTVVVSGVTLTVNKSRDIEDIQQWRQAVEQISKERMSETESVRARSDERFRNLEKTGALYDKQIEGIFYRVTVLEQSMVNQGKVVSDVQTSLNDLKSDLKVVRTILERQDKRSSAQ